jgi:starch synthase (maltosyl-transferring)
MYFDADPDGILAAVLDIVEHWLAHGVRIFRVDNPHTKPVAFWERLFAQLRVAAPDAIFLAEAFTRPAMMRQLAKIGFQQSYTYFTWRTAKWELEQYLVELSTETAAYMRPNFFVNTPDILHASLQYGGPPAFKIRAVLASMLAPSWGVYAGYELYEHVAVRPGSEEYLDSEKYQLRPRDWAAAEAEGRSLAPYLTRLNQIRREHPALQQLRNLRLHRTESEEVMAFSKRARQDVDGIPVDDTVIVVVDLDPHGARETVVELDLPALGLEWGESFSVHDLLTGSSWLWGARNYVRLDPFVEPAHILVVRRSA